MAKKSTRKSEEGAEVKLIKLQVDRLRVKIVGDSALICHKFSTKATRQILDKQMHKAKQAKEAKDPKQDFLDSMYTRDSGKTWLFPASAFKLAAVDACSYVDGITKVAVRGAMHVIGDFVEIRGGRPTMREDIVRINKGSSADVRYRGEFKQWSVELEIRYNRNVLSDEQIVNLLNTAGFSVGVGDWRCQKNGTFGMFHVA